MIKSHPEMPKSQSCYAETDPSQDECYTPKWRNCAQRSFIGDDQQIQTA
jgi:hypothetical protein